jgi:hypothetical protein
MRSWAGIAADSTLSRVVLPLPVPPEITLVLEMAQLEQQALREANTQTDKIIETG